ncbi:hypothetical protein CDAR_600991 [Caerostris darwini]|uniref:Secreted protein n=1 Tax=Caerostris darwini TaxID=1538125 RepID=A0AAV4X3G1_9ARAC|nr:hypothetical protein CDAR_600991 [Caerostris darwini]
MMLIVIRAISHDCVHYFHLVLNVCRAKCLEPQCMNSSRNHNNFGRPFYFTSPAMPPVGDVLDILGNGWQPGQLKCPKKKQSAAPRCIPGSAGPCGEHVVRFNF